MAHNIRLTQFASQSIPQSEINAMIIMTSEKLLEKKLTEKVKSLGGWALKFLPFRVAGMPDRLVLMPGGRAYFVELKSTGEKCSKLQIHIHSKLVKLGFQVWVIDNEDLLIDFLKNIER